jgi:hypothetical protein
MANSWEGDGVASFMRFLPLLATVLMLVYWFYNYYFPIDA